MKALTPFPPLVHVCLAIAHELAAADAALALVAMESMPEAMITKRKRKRKWKRKQCFFGYELLLPPTVSIRSSVAAVVSGAEGGGETGGRVSNERLLWSCGLHAGLAESLNKKEKEKGGEEKRKGKRAWKSASEKRPAGSVGNPDFLLTSPENLRQKGHT